VHHEVNRPPGFAFEGSLRGAYFAQAIGRGQRVVDLGCRDGTVALAYLEGNQVTGLDIDRASLQRASSRGIETIWTNLSERLPLASDSFDVAVAGELFEHLPNPQALVDEAARVLTPKGTLVGSVPNAFRLKNRLRFLAGRPIEPDPTHLHQVSPKGLERLLVTRFELLEVRFAASRFLRLSPRLFGNSMLFLARKNY
jgi:SAM-dependent methyltransferase